MINKIAKHTPDLWSKKVQAKLAKKTDFGIFNTTEKNMSKHKRLKRFFKTFEAYEILQSEKIWSREKSKSAVWYSRTAFLPPIGELG